MIIHRLVLGRAALCCATVVIVSAMVAGCSTMPGAIGEADTGQLTTSPAPKPDSKVALGFAGTKPTDTPARAESAIKTVSTSTRQEVVSTTVAAPAAVGKAADALLATSTPGSTAYRIGPADVIEITVAKVPDLSKQVQVADNGTVNLALIGETKAAGKTAQELERDLTKVLGAKYLQNPTLTVFIREYNSQRVTVEGAVKTPGLFPIRGNSTLLQILATCGGFTEIADSNVLVFRFVGGKRTAAKFEVNDIRTGESPDVPLQAGDVVVVNTSAGKEAFNNFAKIVPLAKAFSFF